MQRVYATQLLRDSTATHRYACILLSFWARETELPLRDARLIRHALHNDHLTYLLFSLLINGLLTYLFVLSSLGLITQQRLLRFLSLGAMWRLRLHGCRAA